MVGRSTITRRTKHPVTLSGRMSAASGSSFQPPEIRSPPRNTRLTTTQSCHVLNRVHGILYSAYLDGCVQAMDGHARSAWRNVLLSSFLAEWTLGVSTSSKDQVLCGPGLSSYLPFWMPSSYISCHPQAHPASVSDAS